MKLYLWIWLVLLYCENRTHLLIDLCDVKDIHLQLIKTIIFSRLIIKDLRKNLEIGLLVLWVDHLIQENKLGK